MPEPKVQLDSRERLNLVVVGHVDHGKSTIIGRLLADTDSLPEGKIEQVRKACKESSKRFEYAFLLDALQDEQRQGITIDSARIFFNTDKRYYIIIDAPGHIEFLRNMVTGASHADAALVVIDAQEGVRENSRRHGYILSMLGITSLVVLINKMDLVDYSEKTYKKLVKEYGKFLKSIDVEPLCYIPVSGIEGANITESSAKMPWYTGDNVLDVLDNLEKSETGEGGDFRMYVQDVYKFTRFGDARRIIAGTVDSGTVRIGDELIFHPSGKKSVVESIETFNAPTRASAGVGEAVGLTLREQIFVTRGELASLIKESDPQVTTRLRASLFWLSPDSLEINKEYMFKIGTLKIPARIEEVPRLIDASSLSAERNSQAVPRNSAAECIIKLKKAAAFDLVDGFPVTSRFVIVDNYRICGGGIIREALEDKQSEARQKALIRDRKWVRSLISPGRRAERYNQKPAMILITGDKNVDRKSLAKVLEAKLFSEGKIVYFLGIGNILYGLDSDLERSEEFEDEHIRRMAEVANIMLDAGIILIVTAAELRQSHVNLMRTLIGQDMITTVWLGEHVSTDLASELHLPEEADLANGAEKIKEKLIESGVIFRPW